MKNFYERTKLGAILMTLTGFGIPFIGAVPLVVLFGGFKTESSNMGDGLASVGHTFLLGLLGYVVLFVYFMTHLIH